MPRRVYKWFLISFNLVMIAWLVVSLISVYTAGSNSDNSFVMFVNTISIDSVYTSMLSVPIFPVVSLCNLVFTDIDLIFLKFISIVMDLNIYICLFNIVCKLFLYLPTMVNNFMTRSTKDD